MTDTERQALAAALQIRAAADGYPRCGADWPSSPAEQQAEAILAAAGYPVALPLCDEMRAQIDAHNLRDARNKAAQESAYQALRAARRSRDPRAVRAAEAAYRAAAQAVRAEIHAYGKAMGAF
jgi:hypothetical protein